MAGSFGLLLEELQAVRSTRFVRGTEASIWVFCFTNFDHLEIGGVLN